MLQLIEEVNKTIASISFKIINTDEELIIKSKFNLLNKSTFGLVLIFCGGLFMSYISITSFLENQKSNELSNIISLVIFGLLSLVLLVVGIIGIYSTSTDYIKVTSSHLEFKNSSFKPTRIKLNVNFRITKRSFISNVSNTRGFGSSFRVIELYIVENNNKKCILNFQMNEKDSDKADKLGEQIKMIISQKKNILLRDKIINH